MKKILFLISDTGGGHRSGANAIVRAIKRLRGENAFDTPIVDAFTATNKYLDRLVKLYFPLTNYLPGFYGWLYHTFNTVDMWKLAVRTFDRFIVPHLASLIEREDPNLIVSVHPMINHFTVMALKELDEFGKIPFILVVTDPVTGHSAWFCPEVDVCVVATNEARELAISCGMPESKLRVIGMPIDPKFLDDVGDRRELRMEWGLYPDRFTVMITGGGEGSGGILKIVKYLDDARLPIQGIVVCGRNERAKKKLESLRPNLSFPLFPFGFTDRMPEIMSASDVMITKAGPGTIAEAMARDLPIIITSHVPGQEEGNVEYARKHNTGVVEENPRKVPGVIRDLIENPAKFDRIKEAVRALRKPRAVMEIAELILGYLE
ncbi:MAG: MGDG synthase family glycosyltransferase [bacterium]